VVESTLHRNTIILVHIALPQILQHFDLVNCKIERLQWYQSLNGGEIMFQSTISFNSIYGHKDCFFCPQAITQDWLILKTSNLVWRNPPIIEIKVMLNKCHGYLVTLSQNAKI